MTLSFADAAGRSQRPRSRQAIGGGAPRTGTAARARGPRRRPSCGGGGGGGGLSAGTGGGYGASRPGTALAALPVPPQPCWVLAPWPWLTPPCPHAGPHPALAIHVPRSPHGDSDQRRPWPRLNALSVSTDSILNNGLAPTALDKAKPGEEAQPPAPTGCGLPGSFHPCRMSTAGTQIQPAPRLLQPQEGQLPILKAEHLMQQPCFSLATLTMPFLTFFTCYKTRTTQITSLFTEEVKTPRFL